MTPMISRPVRVVGLLLAVMVPCTLAVPAQAQTLDQAANAQVAVDKEAAASQDRVNQLRDKTLDAASSYARAVGEAESMEKYNSQLGEQVKEQEKEMASIERQLLEIETTNREVMPLMQKMVDTLEKFVAADVPFLLDERTSRVKGLQALMTRSDVAISEKYRRIIEAYQIELEYGRTLDTYEGPIDDGGAVRTVGFVRLGRVALMYQTLDGAETGYWDVQQHKWVVDNSYAEAVAEARRVARKSGAPDLLRIPVPAPQEGRS
jgi:hypothetical protein